MKKIITFLFFLGVVTVSFAQNGHDRDGRTVNSPNGYYQRDHYFKADRELLIDKINREYDYKIRVIENDFALRRHQKKVAIRRLEGQREMQIRRINEQYRWNGRKHAY